MRIITRRDTGLLTQWTFGTSGLDADATAFLTAAGITDPTIVNAITILVVALKNYGIWTKMKAIYPMVGGTSTTCKFNLVTPADTNLAFRLSFVGGWTFSSNGALPNGVNAYADTFLTPNTSLTNFINLSYYSRTNNNAAQVELSSESSLISIKYIGLGMLSRIYQTVVTSAYTPTVTTGFFGVSRINNTQYKQYMNGSTVATYTAAVAGTGTKTFFIGAFNRVASIVEYSSKECAFASIGDGLTDTEVANLNTAVQAFQLSLSRNV
jgi:hypothetical protein